MATPVSDIPEKRTARWLLRAPLLAPRELASLMHTSEATVYRALRSLERHGIAAHVEAGRPFVPPTRRYWLTPRGLDVMARFEHLTVEEILDSRPVSKDWLHALLRRLDSMIAVYTLAAAVASEFVVEDTRVYRSIPLDAALLLDDGAWVGLHREGPLTTPFHRRRRLKTLIESGIRPAMLVLVQDEARQREWLALLANSEIPGAVAVEERFLVDPTPIARVWLRTGSTRLEPLEDALDPLYGTPVPVEQRFTRASPPPVTVNPTPEPTSAVKDYELPLLLNPFEKKALDLIAAWPFITSGDAADFSGVSRQAIEKALSTPVHHNLVDRIFTDGHRASGLVLRERGLLMLARRDRIPTHHVLLAWSPVNRNVGNDFGPSDLRGSRMRPLLRAHRHTGSVCGFFAVFHRQARRDGGTLTDVESFYRAWRGFSDGEGDGGQLRPDGYAVFQRDGVRVPFFLEWERRADRRSRYLAKLHPYIRYYGSGKACEDTGEWPFVLLVLRNGEIEDEFWTVALGELRSNGVARKLRILTSTERAVLLRGPLGPVWRIAPTATRLPLVEAAQKRPVIGHEGNANGDR